MPRILSLIALLVGLSACDQGAQRDLERIIAAHGGRAPFYALRNACFNYTVLAPPRPHWQSQIMDPPLTPLKRQVPAFEPQVKGHEAEKIRVFFDFARERVEFIPVPDDADRYAEERGFFLFAFPFKLGDEGVTVARAPDATIDGKDLRALRVGNKHAAYDVFYGPDMRIAYLGLARDGSIGGGIGLLVRFDLENYHGLWVAARRTFFARAPDFSLGEPLFTEELSDGAFWCRAGAANQERQTR